MSNQSNHFKQPTSQTCRLAVDIGGTFTDVVLETTNQKFSCKVLTSVNQPELGVIKGIKQLLKESGVDAKDIQSFIHGTTLATNALIERKGAKTAFVTTQGFRDVLGMGFEKRFDAYDINIEIPTELVERPLRFTVTERMSATGRVLLALDEGAVRQVAQQIKQAQVKAVAIGFIHAWNHATHELRAEQILREILGDEVTICLSSQVCPEMREYERFSTTVANAYVRPLMSRYLQRLSDQIKQLGMSCQMLMMMSGGGLTTLQQAVRFPIRLVESGPAGGAILASFIAKESGFDRVMAFDMGGTTAKICLINHGEPERSR
ncbi:MAG: hydantoinase/oxoprolinase family protein, partial [Limnohabitans sp.]|nr:hydantoinase/oxoprolinase family protein [Limnohabitans sp.]